MGAVSRASWPAWLSMQHDLFSKVTDDHFQCILKLWTHLKWAYGFQSDRACALSKDKQPDQVNWWIGHGHKVTAMPPITFVWVFKRQLWKWWVHLQPAWHQDTASDDGSMSHTGPREWDKLAKPGVNGIVSVVACLYWWFKRAAEEDEDDDSHLPLWANIIDDVSWVLTQLVDYVPTYLSGAGGSEQPADVTMQGPARKRFVITIINDNVTYDHTGKKSQSNY
jgi:hypothetical protein